MLPADFGHHHSVSQVCQGSGNTLNTATSDFGPADSQVFGRSHVLTAEAYVQPSCTRVHRGRGKSRDRMKDNTQ